jgi:hypothetical protein
MQQGELRTCPNCSASNRATAKFCVTCGVKMPDVAPAARDPFTSSPATATWPSPTAAPTPAPSGWGNVAPEPPAAPEPPVAPVVAPSGWGNVAPEPPAAPEPPVAPAAAPSWGGWGNTATASAPVNLPAEVVAGMEQALDDDEVGAAVAASVPAAARPAADAPAGSALAQAHELLDTLRDLLPAALAASAGAGDAADVLARTSSDDYAALRGLVAEATARPRDIDVMMRLSQQVADIAALMDERDRLRGALQGFEVRQGS